MEIDSARAELARRGLDLVAPFVVQEYNGAVAPELGLPTFGREATLGLLIGSTKVFWPTFLAALRTQPELQRSEDPVQDFVEGVVTQFRQGISLPTEARFAHETSAGRLVAFQRLAQIAGLAWLAPCNLSIHPDYGPWIALRAAVLIDEVGELASIGKAPAGCDACAAACLPAFERARATLLGARVGTTGEVSSAEDGWRPWLAVREACPLGREHRYSEDQIQYHYGKDRNALLRAAGLDPGIAQP